MSTEPPTYYPFAIGVSTRSAGAGLAGRPAAKHLRGLRPSSSAPLLCNSAALEFENQQNPDAQRRERVATLLRWIGRPEPATARLLTRAAEMVRRGFRDMDALHLAFAEHLKADYFVTVDDEILARSQQVQSPVKFLDAVEAVKGLGL